MRLLQLSTAVPRHRYRTEEMIELLPRELPDEVKKNILNLGVYTRYFVNPIDFSSKSARRPNNEEPVADLSAIACRQALERSGLSSGDIDYLIVTYDSSAFLCPGLSNFLLSELDFSPSMKHVSIQGMACAAFSRGIQLAGDHLARFPQGHVMLSLSGANSYWFYNQVRGLKDIKGISEIRAIENDDLKRKELRKWIAIIEFFLFGDGSACIVLANDGGGPELAEITSVTNLRQSDYFAGFAKLTCLEGPFKFGFYSNLEKNIPTLGMKYTGIALEKLSHGKSAGFKDGAKRWIVHTGSKRILDEISRSNGIDYEKISDSYNVLSNYGNLAGASLSFILEKIIHEGKLSNGDYAIMLGYGWGFTANAGLIIF